jgi:uncharacterized Ntn-hydrolase superfamily protein
MISPIRSSSGSPSHHGLHHWWFLALQLLLTTTTTTVDATFSIIAVDRTNGVIGAAGASCSQHLDSNHNGDDIIYIIPGRGILVTQALAMGGDAAPVLLGESLLQNHTSPQEILNRITDPFVDHESGALSDAYLLRQYGVVDFDGRAAGYTGSSLNMLYDDDDNEQRDLQGSYTDDLTGADYVYSIQGNLVSHRTLEIVESTFLLDGCDLAEKLYLAVMEVDLAGEGDVRCPENVAGSTAFLQVENQQGEILASTTAHVNIDDPDSAFERLATEFDSFRRRAPCPGEGVDANEDAASAAAVPTTFGNTVAFLAAMAAGLLSSMVFLN